MVSCIAQTPMEQFIVHESTHTPKQTIIPLTSAPPLSNARRGVGFGRVRTLNTNLRDITTLR
jgi:hypothetical protein